MFKKDQLQLYTISIIILLSLIFSNKLTVYQVISLMLFVFVVLKFIYDLGSKISIKNILVLILVLQVLVGPVLGYIYDSDILLSYQMKVGQSTYFGYVLPAVFAFIFGLYLKTKKQKYKPNFSSSVDYYQKGVKLIIIGFFFEFLPWFGFLGYLLAGLKYVGVFYVMFSPNKKRYWWTAIVFGYLFFVHSLGGGAFHELLLWSCFLLIIMFYFNRKTFLFRLGVIFSGFFFAFIIQLVKPDYRAKAVLNNNSSNYILFFTLITDKLTNEQSLFSDEVIANNVVRINQGWIISYVMNYIPSHRPYANGKTVEDAIVASIFPRFLYPNKPIAGGRANMENYAGYTLNEGTSMDISQVGEAYANFGVTGGIIMMFCLGLFSNIVISFVEKKCLIHPELILWLPLLYLQVVKAETSLVTVLNHLTKAGLVTWFFFTPWGYKILDYHLGRWKFGVRTFRLSSGGIGSFGVRRRKGPKLKKGFTTFEDRAKRKNKLEI
jgi:hypothetical protein